MIWVRIAIVAWTAAIARAGYRRYIDWLTRPRRERLAARQATRPYDNPDVLYVPADWTRETTP